MYTVQYHHTSRIIKFPDTYGGKKGTFPPNYPRSSGKTVGDSLLFGLLLGQVVILKTETKNVAVILRPNSEPLPSLSNSPFLPHLRTTVAGKKTHLCNLTSLPFSCPTVFPNSVPISRFASLTETQSWKRDKNFTLDLEIILNEIKVVSLVKISLISSSIRTSLFFSVGKNYFDSLLLLFLLLFFFSSFFPFLKFPFLDTDECHASWKKVFQPDFPARGSSRVASRNCVSSGKEESPLFPTRDTSPRSITVSFYSANP